MSRYWWRWNEVIDFLPEIPNMYFYGATGVSIRLIGVLQIGARRSIYGLIGALENSIQDN